MHSYNIQIGSFPPESFMKLRASMMVPCIDNGTGHAVMITCKMQKDCNSLEAHKSNSYTRLEDGLEEHFPSVKVL